MKVKIRRSGKKKARAKGFLTRKKTKGGRRILANQRRKKRSN